MKHCTLVVLAAGLGSRFGGNKQISEVGPSGEYLMEYSIHDAIEAGFDRVVFVLKRDMVETVKQRIGNRLERRIRVDYAVQEFDSLPQFYQLPADRVKPFGTVHAVLSAAEYLDAPFATVNADDYYGKEVFRLLNGMLTELKEGRDAAMVPYVLGNTMSRNGGVTRGICTIREGKLVSVEETKNIRYGEGDAVICDRGELSPSLPVSMNIWGFHPDFRPVMQAYFEDFLRQLSAEDLTGECLLPVMVNDLLREGRLTVSAQCSGDSWFGMTYREDVAETKARLLELTQAGMYPRELY